MVWIQKQHDLKEVNYKSALKISLWCKTCDVQVYMHYEYGSNKKKIKLESTEKAMSSHSDSDHRFFLF